MNVDNICDELFLWEQLQLSEDASWTNDLSVNLDGGLLGSGDKSLWLAEDVAAKICENAPLAFTFGSDKCNIDDPLADWLDERIEIEEIDEIVNSPDFDAVMLDMSGSEASSILEDILPLPLDSEDAVSNSSVDHVKFEAYTSDSSSSSTNMSPEQNVIVDGCSLVDDITNVDFLHASPQLVRSPSGSHTELVDEESVSHSSFEDVDSFSSSLSSSPEMQSSSEDATHKADGKLKRNRRYQPSKSNVSTKRQRLSNETDYDDCDSFQPTDRKAKKRSQNKSAATRYRTKKRAEFDTLVVEEAKLEDTNKQLHSQATQLQTEINYLKGLMKEILIAKGILKK